MRINLVGFNFSISDGFNILGRGMLIEQSRSFNQYQVIVDSTVVLCWPGSELKY
jgi:hypothetical protein